MRVIRRFFLAVTAVTSLPLADLHHDPHALSGLSKYLPSVGLLIGLLLVAGAVLLCGLCHASALTTGIVLSLWWLVISGGIHFDGLMDAADGLFSHRSPERMLEIMRDSRVGNFGVMTGVAVTLIKVGGIAALLNSGKACAIGGQGMSVDAVVAFLHVQAKLLCALILIPVWSRWCETFAIGGFPYLRAQGLGKIWHDTTRFPRDLILALITPLFVSVLCGTFLGVTPAIVCSVSTVACGLVAAHYISRVLGGHTGDTYGAVVELGEAGALFIAMLLQSLW